MKRFLAVLLSALMLISLAPAYAQEVATPPEAETTPIPVPEATQAPVVTPAPEITLPPDQTVPPAIVITPIPDYYTPVPSPTPDTGSIGTSTLKKGSEGDAVTNLQKRLAALGYFKGTATGYFGEETKQAVIAFQKAKGLTADGVVGRDTRTVLNGGTVSTPNPASPGEATPRPTRFYTPRPSAEEEEEYEEEAERPVYEYDETDVRLEADGYEIPATVTVPLGTAGQRFPCVVMCHGYGSNRHEAGNGYDLLAQLLAQNGIATIRYDYKGCGDSQEDYMNFTFPDAVEEAMLSYEYMTSREDIDTLAMGIMGWSMGGGVALVTAGQYDMFDSVLTWAGACYDGTVDQDEYAAAQSQGYFEATFDWREPLRQSAAYYESFMALNVEESVANINPPILAINGTLDTTVVPETAQKIVDASQNGASRVQFIEGADHTFNIFSGDMTAFDALCDVTVKWFIDTL